MATDIWVKFRFRRNRSVLTAHLDSVLPGVRFRVTATVTVQRIDDRPGAPRRTWRRDAALVRQALRDHFGKLLGNLEPTDTAVACDVLYGNELPEGTCPGLLIDVDEIVVVLDSAARKALADYDVAIQAVHMKSYSLAVRIGIIRASLNDPATALAWLANQSPGLVTSDNVKEVIASLETLATKFAPRETVPKPADEDPVIGLVRAFIEPIPHPLQRATAIKGLAEVFEDGGAKELAARARALIAQANEITDEDLRRP